MLKNILISTLTHILMCVIGIIAAATGFFIEGYGGVVYFSVALLIVCAGYIFSGRFYKKSSIGWKNLLSVAVVAIVVLILSLVTFLMDIKQAVLLLNGSFSPLVALIKRVQDLSFMTDTAVFNIVFAHIAILFAPLLMWLGLSKFGRE